MAQVVSIDTQTAKKILSTLEELKREVSQLREKIDAEPEYGTDKWWEWSDKKALEDIKKGRYTYVGSSKKEIQGFLDSLKTDSV